MTSVLKHWKEAATLLLVAKTKTPVVTSFQTTNYQILMLKRSGKSKFMPKLHVFPGGMSHDSDFSPEWMNLYSQTGSDVVNSLNELMQRGGAGPFMFSRNRSEDLPKIPSELAFRICAIRETFEESGILLVRDINRVKNEQLDVSKQPLSGSSSILSDSILMPWRQKVDRDAWQFIRMCEELHVVPDVWSLFEWSNWLTPVIPKRHDAEKARGRRFDTAFFLSVLDYTPVAVHDDKETTELEWSAPSQLLQKHLSADIDFQLAPPQILELGRLLNFNCADDLRKFSWDRSSQRVVRWFPITCMCDDGVLFLYPGDDLYPEDPDVEGSGPVMVVPGTITELRQKHRNIYRSELHQGAQSNLARTMQCNLTQSVDGQVLPVFDMLRNAARAKY